MREANTFDFSLLILLAIIWGSSFFNIKLATYSYEPITLALVRVIFASIPLLILCKIKNIYIEAFTKNWKPYALIGYCKSFIYINSFIKIVFCFFYLIYCLINIG